MKKWMMVIFLLVGCAHDPQEIPACHEYEAWRIGYLMGAKEARTGDSDHYLRMLQHTDEQHGYNGGK
jgi:hypothetical protein